MVTFSLASDVVAYSSVTRNFHKESAACLRHSYPPGVKKTWTSGTTLKLGTRISLGGLEANKTVHGRSGRHGLVQCCSSAEDDNHIDPGKETAGRSSSGENEESGSILRDDDDANFGDEFGGMDWRTFRAKLVAQHEQSLSSKESSSSAVSSPMTDENDKGLELWQERMSVENWALLASQNPLLAQEVPWVHPTGGPERGGLLLAAPSAIIPGVFMGGLEAAAEDVLSGHIPPTDFRFFVGRVEWIPGKLKKEVEAGVWLSAACARPLILKQCLHLPKPLWPSFWGIPRLHSAYMC
eukprot:TRINITY_DN6933_c0_g1_i6.p1 TRINITY_DN6933_c0_g1~~TRINITY_DN6933_c0_g1_i6.p1  ORF type:complete len:296 (+),score=45.09 TRINITY_DN6933_c0_g1_i6:102-989(+)